MTDRSARIAAAIAEMDSLATSGASAEQLARHVLASDCSMALSHEVEDRAEAGLWADVFAFLCGDVAMPLSRAEREAFVATCQGATDSALVSAMHTHIAAGQTEHYGIALAEHTARLFARR